MDRRELLKSAAGVAAWSGFWVYHSRAYAQEFSQISLSLMNPLSHEEWYELYTKLTSSLKMNRQ